MLLLFWLCLATCYLDLLLWSYSFLIHRFFCCAVDIMLLGLRRAFEMFKVNHSAYVLEIVGSFLMATNGRCQGVELDIAWSLAYNIWPRNAKLSSLLEAEALDPFLYYYGYRLKRRQFSYQPVREGNNRHHLITKGQNNWKNLFDRGYQYPNQ